MDFIQDRPTKRARNLHPNDSQFPLFDPDLLPFDLTRGGTLFRTASMFPLHTDVKELALYVEDTITKGNWSLQSRHARRYLQRHLDCQPGRAARRHRLQRQAEQHGASRLLRTDSRNSVQRESGAFQHRMQLSCLELAACLLIRPPSRAVHTRLSQRISRRPAASLRDATWSSTANTSGSTRTTPTISACSATLRSRSRSSGTAPRFPDSPSARPCPNFHGVHGVCSDVQRRCAFFHPPARGSRRKSLGAWSVFSASITTNVYNETTHLQYQPWKTGPSIGFNWRYDSGLVAGATPCYGVSGKQHLPGLIFDWRRSERQHGGQQRGERAPKRRSGV